MSIVNSFRQESTLKLNDIIEEYKYVYKGQEVKSGDFVNYIEGLAGKKDYGESVDTQLSTTSYSGNIISAVQLDENRIFIAHQMTSDIDSTSSLYGVIVTVNGATISSGEDTLLVSGKYSGHEFSAALLGNGNVFIAYMYYTGSNYQVYGMVCSATGTTITILTNSQAINASYSSAFSEIKVCVLPSNKIFIAYGAYTNSYLYCSMCSISDTTITKGNELQLSTQTNSGVQISTCLLPNGNVFIAHSYGSNRYLYGIVCSISGTTITAGSDTALATSYGYSGSVISTETLSNGNVFIAHSWYSEKQLAAMVCTISGTTITKGTDINLGTQRTADAISTKLLPNGGIFIAHSHYGDGTISSPNYHQYGMICSISETTITIETDTILNRNAYTGYTMSTLSLQNGTIFIAHSNSSSRHLYAQIFGIDYENNIPTNHIVITEYEQQVTPAIAPPFDAVALSSGVGAPIIEQEVTKTDNAFYTTWENVSDKEAIGENGNTMTLDASVYSTDMPVSNICDGSTSTYTRTDWGNIRWVKMELPNPLKILKMKLQFKVGSTSAFDYAIVQGSNNNSEWVELYRIEAQVSSLTEITLNNPDYYKYYRIYFWFGTSSTTSYANIYEWQTSEYIVKEQVPSTEHNEQVKIARVYKEVEKEVVKTGNIFPISSWTKVNNLKYTHSSGYIIEASSASSVYLVSNACDGTTNTLWGTEQTEWSTNNNWFMITCPEPKKVTKLKTCINSNNYFSNAVIRGSKDKSNWVDLYNMTTQHTALTEITLNNVDYYTYYRIEIGLSSAAQANVYELQTSEYIEKVTEVIQ